ncbi:MAG: carboxymuconolactone decarboxylase family protein [Pseudomonadota bacterium]
MTAATTDTLSDRMPPLELAQMNDAQRSAAEALTAGPRGGVFGPFVPLLRSPALMDRLQRVGEYLRFQSSVPARLNEFAMMVVSREWTQQFEWAVHRPLALKAGLAPATAEALAQGRRPDTLAADEAVVYDFTDELLRRHGVCDTTYARARELLGEQGVLDLVGLLGYFTTLSMVMNVAHTPRGADAACAPLDSFPF